MQTLEEENEKKQSSTKTPAWFDYNVVNWWGKHDKTPTKFKARINTNKINSSRKIQ